ncbi:hypothetical protein SDC9_86945 [bioreactor metagenome]|uniref:Uncharacterized protein n=1 Tax=bioreactor metagenome TaxID=1076179 RepID=A0A644ZHC8_9ZZZZ
MPEQVDGGAAQGPKFGQQHGGIGGLPDPEVAVGDAAVTGQQRFVAEIEFDMGLQEFRCIAGENAVEFRCETVAFAEVGGHAPQ